MAVYPNYLTGESDQSWRGNPIMPVVPRDKESMGPTLGDIGLQLGIRAALMNPMMQMQLSRQAPQSTETPPQQETPDAMATLAAALGTAGPAVLGRPFVGGGEDATTASGGTGQTGGSGSTGSSVSTVPHSLGVSAPNRVSPNDTTNYGGSPVRIDSDGIYNVPDGSLGGLESYAAFRGTTAGALAQQEDALKARGMQESEYWQDQYAQALQQTGNPNLARAHANLAATQASDNAYGVFDRAMAEQTMNASALGNNQVNGQLYLDRNAGAVNQNLLSTAPQAYGENGSGGTLIRLPSGQVVSANMNANTPAMISATSLGADAAYNQDVNYTQAMAKLDQMKAQLSGAGGKSNPNDPMYQLNQQMKIMQIQKAQQALSRGEMPKMGSIPWEALPQEVQEQQIQLLLGGYGNMGDDQGRVE